MSIEAVRYVLENSKQKGSERLLLIVIAEHADADGQTWPGNALLARESNMSERQVQRIIQSLAVSGELKIVSPGDGRGNKRVLQVVIKGDKSGEKGDILSTKGDILSTKGANGVTLSEEKRVTNSTVKGDIFDIKGDKSSIKGDIAMSPEPINQINQKNQLIAPTPSDRDGRWLIQKLEEKGFLYKDTKWKELSIKLESDFDDTQLLQAMETTAEAHQKKINNGERGITAPLAYMQMVLTSKPKDTPQPSTPVRQSKPYRGMQVLA